jgi:hypothetical protein
MSLTKSSTAYELQQLELRQLDEQDLDQFTPDCYKIMSLTKSSTAYELQQLELQQRDEQDLDLCYLEYLHDQACIARDQVIRILQEEPETRISDALYQHFYELTRRKA